MSRLVLCLVAAALLLPPPAVSAAGEFNPPWLNVSDGFVPDGDVLKGWTFRIPVKLPDEGVVVDGLARVQLDLGKAAIEAKWPTTGSGEGLAPVGFEPDLDSLQLTRYSTNWISRMGNVPTTTYQRTWLDPPSEATIGPLVTLEWLVPDRGEGAGEPARFYMVYLDVRQNQDPAHPKPTATPSAHDMERLGALYWIGTGTMLYTNSGGSAGFIEVVAAQDDTEVTIRTSERDPGQSPSQFQDHVPAVGHTNPFRIANAGGMVRYPIENKQRDLQVFADKPVAAFEQQGVGGGGEFYPSLEGTTVGRTFVFPVLSTWAIVMVPTGPDATSVRFCVSRLNEADAESGKQCTPSDVQPGGYLVYRTSLEPQASSTGAATMPPPAIRVRVQVTSQEGVVMVQSWKADGSATVTGGATTQIPSTAGSPVGARFLSSTMAGNSAEGFLLEDSGSGSVVHVAIPKSDGFLEERGFPVALGPGEKAFVSGTSRNFPMSYKAGPDTATANQQKQQTPPRVDFGLYHAETPPISLEAEEGGNLLVRVGKQGRPVVSQTTPFGGIGARSFVVEGNFSVYPFYDDTALIVSSSDPDQGSQSLTAATASAVPFEVSRGAVTRVWADKPVAVLPMVPPGTPSGWGSYGKPFAAKPAAAVATDIRPAEYRGYLVDLRPDGSDEVGLNGAPDTTVELPLVLSNLGRWNGRGLPDTIEVLATASGVPGIGLEITDSGDSPVQEVELAGAGASTTLKLRVTIPADMQEEDEATVTVVATSTKNPRMQSLLTVPVSTRQVLGVEASFGTCASCGERDIRPALAKTEHKAFDFAVGNLGSGPDTFDLNVTQFTTGETAAWTASLDGGQRTGTTGPMAAGQEKAFKLHVTAPKDDRAPPATIFVKVHSRSNPAVAVQIFAFARIAAVDALRLDSPDQFQRIAPGSTASYQVELLNNGNTSFNAKVSLGAGLPDGWTATLHGEGIASMDSVAVGKHDKRRLAVELTAPADAVAGQLIPLLVNAEVVGNPSVRDAIGLNAEVFLQHNLVLGSLPNTAARPGQEIPLELKVHNQGNGLEQVVVNATSLPANWTLTASPTPLNLTAGVLASLPFVVKVAPDAEPGIATVKVAAIAADGVRSVATLAVTVLPGDGLVWRPAAPLTLAPDAQGKRALFVENHGNRALSVKVSVTAPAGWSAQLTPDSFDLPRGGVRLVTLEATAPAVGGSSGQLVVLAKGGGAESKAIVLATLEGIDLRLAKVTAPPLPPRQGEVGFLTATLRNEGNATLKSVSVRLLAGGEVLDEARFASMGANATVLVPLRWVQNATAPPDRIVWGLGEASAFKAMGSQAFAQAGSEQTQASPAAGLSLVLVAFALAARRRMDPA